MSDEKVRLKPDTTYGANTNGGPRKLADQLDRDAIENAVMSGARDRLATRDRGHENSSERRKRGRDFSRHPEQLA